MSLVPDPQPYTLQEIATAMLRICAKRGYRVGWMRPTVFSEQLPNGLLQATWPVAYFPRDWLGRLVTDIPARLVEDIAA